MQKIKLYAGDVPNLKQYNGLLGLSLTQQNSNHIRHNLTSLPLPFQDNTVDFFQSEDVFEHIDIKELVKIINDIYRILKPDSLFRLSVPDYNCDILYKRSYFNYEGSIVFDPGGGGTFENPGHVWFPTYELAKNLLSKTKFSKYGKIEFLHYWIDRKNFITKQIDYNYGFIQRTPDNDNRVASPYRPMSLVIDLYKQ